MGHIRLGALPRTRKWSQVVGLIRGGAGVAQIANATITAAEVGLRNAVQDKGVLETIWLLTQLPIAARSDDFAAALRECGLNVSDSPGLMEIIGAVTDVIDAQMPNCKGRTDLGEMAQMAAVETLTQVIGGRLNGNLFGTTPEDVQKEFSKLATNKQFSIFAKDFFGRFTYKCLDYFVSKAISDPVGESQRFRTLAEQSEFTKALARHCQEASKIIEEFSGGWFSKKNWETDGNITREEIKKFTGYAMKKLADELKQGATSNGK
ncbi:MAG: hypothetical protein LC104_04915 [Bacteroidales bacterium]|nr:hypothetical protein [Bacteroidales bacterium]